MKYNYNGKEYDVPDDVIDKMVDTLDCSIVDACENWLADNDLITNETQDNLDKEAKKGKRHYEKSGNPRKKAKKVRKVDENKGDLLKTMAIALIEKHNCTEMTQKTETELHFEYKNEKYTVKLTKHRPKKA